MTTQRIHLNVLALVALACVAASLAVGARDAAGATPSTVPCASSAENARACVVVGRFFEDAAGGRYAASCAALGARLRYESGGHACARRLSSAYFVGSRAWAVIGARASEAGVGVVVRLDLPELDRVRRLLWLATVGMEGGRRRILATRIVGDLGSLRTAPVRRTLGA